MKRRLPLIFIWFLYLIQSTTTFALQQIYDDSSDVDTLGSLRSYLRSYPRHDNYHSNVYSKISKDFVNERSAKEPSGLYGNQENLEDSEIDAIGSQRGSSSFLGKDGDDTVPPASESASRSITGAASQPETVPVVVQKMSGDGQKESRAPQKQSADALARVSAVDGEQTVAQNDVYFIGLVAGCSGAALFGVMAAGFCWYKLQKNAKAAAAADYPAYGVTGPSKEAEVTSPPNGDRKLAQNAQMFHYQHQKQQMIAIEKAASDRRASTSDLDSEEENEEGDYTVYECPGLAPTGEMEVKNPLFRDDPTPVSPPATSKDSEKHLQQ